MAWHLSRENDPDVRVLADRHYSRQNPGTARFVQAGRALVLKVPGGRLEWSVEFRGGRVLASQVVAAQAGWVTHWPKYVRHEWAGAWVNQFFRNESKHHASDLIRQAVAATLAVFGPAPPLGLVTMIDATAVRSLHFGHKVGHTYLKAGFSHVGYTKTDPKKTVFQLLPSDMPDPQPPVGYVIKGGLFS